MVAMSICFGVGQGCLTAVLVLSPMYIDFRLFSFAAGTLYLTFGLGAVVSPLIVLKLGLLHSLVGGLLSYAVFVAAFLVPSLLSLLPAAVLAGGFGAALWTAQGVYLTRNAVLYAHDCGPDADRHMALSCLASAFTAINAVILALAKAASSVVTSTVSVSPSYLYAIYLLLAVLAAGAMTQVLPLDTENDAFRRFQCSNKGLRGFASSVWVALYTTFMANTNDLRMVLMIPTNMAFGTMAAYFPLVVTELVRSGLGEVDVGWLYAVSGIAGAILAVAYGVLAEVIGDRHGRAVVMVIGALSFGAICAFVLFSRDSNSFTLTEMVILFILYGSGNAVWQGTCMALFSEYWSSVPEVAFANLKFHSGLSSAIAFYILPVVPGLWWRSLVCFVTVIFGVTTYMACHWVHLSHWTCTLERGSQPQGSFITNPLSSSSPAVPIDGKLSISGDIQGSQENTEQLLCENEALST